jgi:hypothetical protein
MPGGRDNQLIRASFALHRPMIQNRQYQTGILAKFNEDRQELQTYHYRGCRYSVSTGRTGPPLLPCRAMTRRAGFS